MSTIIVTGAAGFIGYHVSELLLEQGHHVVGIDNLNDAYDVNLKYWRLDQLQSEPNFEFQYADIGDKPAMNMLFEEISNRQEEVPAAIIHLAARAGVRQSVIDPWVYYQTNVTGTLNLLEECKAHSIRKFVLASTSSLYGQKAEVPSREDQPTDKPLSPYTASKKAAEVLCHTYHYLYGIDVTILRYFTVFGPAGRPDMSLFRFIKWVSEGKPVQIFGDGSQSRDFTYVSDVARGTVAGLKMLGFETINLGSDTPIVLLDAISKIESIVGRPAQLELKSWQPADVPMSWADVSRAKHLLGWSPEICFDDGLRYTIEWYQENGDYEVRRRLG